MYEIKIKNHCDKFQSQSDGEKIRNLIEEVFARNESVQVSFKDVPSMSVSFINTAFVCLLDNYSYEFIKKNLHFVDSNNNYNSIIRERFIYDTRKE